MSDKEMIPKIIHYCWFGKNPKPKLAEKCILSWKKYCSDYQFIEWTEDNFSLSSAPQYVQDAYTEKKWAFVSDYVRFVALVEYGGIYLDTDVELLKPLDSLLCHTAFSGTEDGNFVSAGIMGCEKGYPLFREFRDFYKTLSFYNPDGTQNTTTVVVMLTEWCKAKGYRSENVYQEIQGFAVYPSEYFYPLSNADRVMRKSENTIAIHWFAGSWVSAERKRKKQRRQFKNRIKPMIVAVIGNNTFERLKKVFHYQAKD